MVLVRGIGQGLHDKVCEDSEDDGRGPVGEAGDDNIVV